MSDTKEAVREILRSSMAAPCPDPDLAVLFAADSARECRDTDEGLPGNIRATLPRTSAAP